MNWVALIKLLVPIVIGIVKPHLAPKAGEIIDAVINTEHNSSAVGKAKTAQAINLMAPNEFNDDDIADVMSKSVDMANRMMSETKVL